MTKATGVFFFSRTYHKDCCKLEGKTTNRKQKQQEANETRKYREIRAVNHNSNTDVKQDRGDRFPNSKNVLVLHTDPNQRPAEKPINYIISQLYTAW